jgi:hypothetical protein
MNSKKFRQRERIMKIFKQPLLFGFLTTVAVCALFASAQAQTKAAFEVLTGAALTKVVPTSFYFAGQSAETQMRNAAAARLGENRLIIAAMVDTSGYSTEISGIYEGFLITDSPVKFGDRTLETGAYGFGFAAGGKVNVFDLGSKQILSASTTADEAMKRPRPLQMTAEVGGVRLYKGKNYVLIAPK